MINYDLLIDLLLSAFWAFSLAVFAIPPIIRVSYSKELLDEPNDRTVHVDSTPRLGGLAIFAGFITSLTIFGTVTPEIQRMMASCMLLFFIGVKDDVTGVSAFKKFFIQCIAAGLVVFIADLRITNFQGFLGLWEIDDNVSYLFTMLTMLMIINAVNLMDGLDGLAGSVSLIILSIFAYFFLSSSTLAHQAFGLLCVSMAGAILGFLRFNFTKASIFMGDTGSLLIGFVVATSSIHFVEMQPVESTPALAIAILVVPVFDTLRVFAFRTIKGVSPFSPDKNHLHHILLANGFSQVQVVLFLMGFTLLLSTAVYLLVGLGNNTLIFTLVFFLLLLSGLLSFLHKKAQKEAKP